MAFAQVGLDRNQTILTKYRSLTHYRDLSALTATDDISFNSSLKKYMTVHGLLDEKLPAMKAVGDDFVMTNYSGLKFWVNFTTFDVVVTYKNKEIRLDHGMTFEEMKKKLETFTSTQQFNVMSLLINDAYADPFILPIVILILIGINAAINIYLMDKGEAFSKAAKNLEAECNSNEKAYFAVKPSEIAEIKKAYKAFVENHKLACTSIAHSSFKPGCATMARTKDCYGRIVAKSGKVDRSDRKVGKDMSSDLVKETPRTDKQTNQQ
jgi:hypothetical protein